MTSLGVFKRKKKEAEIKPETTTSTMNVLEELCKGDKELYNALTRTLLLNFSTTAKAGEMNAVATRAQEYEKKDDVTKARIEYRLAGEIALYEGKTADVQKLFKKAAEVDPSYFHKGVFEYLAKKENAEKAVAVAKEYYAYAAKHAL